jgi:hypothetical protein
MRGNPEKFRTSDDTGQRVAGLAMPIVSLMLGIAVAPVAAQAGPCSQEIARLEILLSRAEATEAPLPSAPESDFAKLHRQPTPKTVTQATSEAGKKTAATLERAHKLDAEGKESECMAALQDAAVLLGAH